MANAGHRGFHLAASFGPKVDGGQTHTQPAPGPGAGSALPLELEFPPAFARRTPLSIVDSDADPLGSACLGFGPTALDERGPLHHGTQDANWHSRPRDSSSTIADVMRLPCPQRTGGSTSRSPFAKSDGELHPRLRDRLYQADNTPIESQTENAN